LPHRFSENGENVIAAPRNEAQTSLCFVRGANDTEERMRVRFIEAAAAAGLLALGLAGCSDGGAKTKVAQAQQVVLEGVSVTASGCVRPVEKTDCLVVKGRGGGYYDISTASPAPDLSKGVAVSLRGKDLGKNTQCGRQLTDVKWSYLGIQCGATMPATASATPDKGAKADKAG
jgi:hypothetical protein